MGGPPVKPLQPEGVSEVAYGNPKWQASSGSDRYRRSLYTYTKRTAPFAMFNAFDAPTGESCVAQRNRSNSPLQALTLLNDVMMTDLSRHAGRRFATDNADLPTQLSALFRSIVVRPPLPEELSAIEAFYREQHRYFSEDIPLAHRFLESKPAGTQDDNAATLAAWTATARALFGLDETLSRE